IIIIFIIWEDNMLDIKRIRKEPEKIVEALNKRSGNFPIEELLELDEKRRNLIQEVEALKAEQNKISKEIPKYKKEGKDTTQIFKDMKELSNKIKDEDKVL